MNEKDVAVVGVGYWGKNLARNYYELGVLHTICERNLDRLNECKLKFTDIQFSDDFQQVLANPDIKKIVIATPTHLHFSLAKQALIAQKDVFVEKAMCETTIEAHELIELAQKMGKILMVGHLLHYHPAIVAIKKMINNGELGDIYHYSFKRLNFGSMGVEDSALWAFAPHDISILLSLTKGNAITQLQTRHRSFYSENNIDESWLHFDFSNNLSADIHVGWSYPYAERKLTIMGTAGSVMFDDLRSWGEKLAFWNNQIQIQNGKIQFSKQECCFISLENKEPLKEECLHFIACCKGRVAPLTDGWEGLQVLEVLEQAKEISKTFLPV